jgi:3-phosphoshikimate 1-carboxyvinyltransferase
MGDILVQASFLKGAKVHSTQIPSLIDELPVLMVAACFARGRTVLEGIQELRVKETDRIDSMVAGLSAMGADIRVVKTKNGENIVIRGNKPLHGAVVRSFGDHRTAMSMAVAGLAAGGRTVIEDTSCVKKSFPAFFTVLKQLLQRS